MSRKVWKFEITVDSTNEGSEYGDYLGLASGTEATKSIQAFIEDLLIEPSHEFISACDIELVSWTESEFTGQEGNEEELKSFYYLRDKDDTQSSSAE